VVDLDDRRGKPSAISRGLRSCAGRGRARTQPALGLVTLDLDHFKALNDTHGHAFGDDVLRLVGARLREAVRETDLVGRVGGEELALLLPGAGPDIALEIAERARIASSRSC